MAAMLFDHNEDAAREYMCREMCQEFGFTYCSYTRTPSGSRLTVMVMLPKPVENKDVFVDIDEPDPKNFPSEAFKQKLMLLA